MSRPQRLELNWVGKDQRPRLEPRILLEDPERSYHLDHRIASNDLFDHRIIGGDNLLALKALEQEFAGRIKCAYLDPPYNTGTAFTDFQDGLEHSLWLSMMRDRLELTWRLLRRDNGTLLISINDDECHYLKVLCDELFGRQSFVASLVWNYEGNTDNQAKVINYHEYILVYSKTGDIDQPGVIDPSIPEDSKLFRGEIRNTIVKNGPKNPPRKVLIPAGFPTSFPAGIILSTQVKYPRYSSDITVANSVTLNEVIAETGWSSKELLEEFIASGFGPIQDSKGQATRFEITKTGAVEAVKVRQQEKGHFVSVLRGLGTTNQMRLMLERLGIRFSYPKPVGLISYLIEAVTQPEDWVLDSFAGSGTTGHAVLKLNLERGSHRRFILVELNPETVERVLLPRMRAVIAGAPVAGIGAHGGGYRFYRLAPSLMERDQWGNWVISKDYNAAMLAEAVCKLEGFTYAPSEEHYWQHGQSTEHDFIYITTQTLTRPQLDQLSADVGSGRTLLVCCAAFRGAAEGIKNLTLKKIPQAVLDKCEWGRDDYSLQVSELSTVPREEPEQAALPGIGVE